MKANLQLFLDKFISVNQQKYADQPEVLALLDGLTLDDIVFTRVEKDASLGDGGRIADFESSTRHFNAVEQQWICADLGSTGIVDTIDDTVFDTIDDIIAVGVAGVYRLKAADVDRLVVVLDHADMTEDEIKTAVVSAIAPHAAYVLTPEDFGLPSPVTVGTQFEAGVSSNTIHSAFDVAWLPAAGGGEEPGGGETDPGTGGETGGGETGGDGGGTTDPEEELPQPPAQTEEEKALSDVTADGAYAAPGEPGFGILTEERTVTTDPATITTATPVASFAMPYFTAPSA